MFHIEEMHARRIIRLWQHVIILIIMLTSVWRQTGLASSQTPSFAFEHLTREQGLLSERVNAIVQDQQGFLWFGTANGLFRYDGYALKRYAQESGSLPEDYVFALHVDRSGTLWVGMHTQGLYRFDHTSEQFAPVGLLPENTPGADPDIMIRAIYEDRQGGLWIGTEEHGAFLLKPGSAEWVNYRHHPDRTDSLNSDAVFSFHEDRSGAIWVGTRNGLNRFDRNANQWTSYFAQPAEVAPVSNRSIFSLAEDQHGAIWFGIYDVGLYRFDPRAEQLDEFVHDPQYPGSLSENKVYSVYFDRSGALWAGTWSGGLNRFDLDTGQFTCYCHDPLDGSSIGKGAVRAIYEDRAGSLWFGVDGWGASALHRSLAPFRHYIQNPCNPDRLSDSAIRCIYQDRRGAIWISTVAGGLNRLDPETGQFTHYRHDPDDPHSLSDNSLYAIFEDQAGALWVGAYNGLNRFDPAAQQFIRYINSPEDPSSLSHNFVLSLAEDKQGNLWIGTQQGLNRFDRRTHGFERHLSDPEDPGSLSDDLIMTVFFDSANTFWVGTLRGGLNRFDPDQGAWRHYRPDPENPFSLSHDRVYVLYEDSAGRFWVGTADGLNLLDRDTGRSTRYTQQEGLPSAAIVGILEDEQGHLWLNTFDGLSRFDPRAETFTHYDSSDGLVNSEYNYASSIRTREGELWFGGKKGIDVVDPGRIIENSYLPPVVLTDIEINNTPVSIERDTATALRLSYQERVISVEFAALNFIAPQKNRYAYKLEGFDREWVETGSDRRRATYTNLDPGKYLFRVCGSNNDGLWNETGASLSIIITPPWWKTWWFYALCLMTVFGVFGLAYWSKTRQLRKERAMAAALRESEQRLKVMIQNSPLGIGIVDSAGKLVGCNQALADMVGYSQKELLQLNFADFTHPEDLEREWQLIQEMWAQQTDSYRMEKRYTRKDGTIIWVNVTAAVIMEGEALHFGFAFVEDITPRKQADEALHQSKKELQLTLEATTDGLWKWNFDENTLFFSPRYYTMLGYEPDEFPATYQNWKGLIHPDDRERALTTAMEYLAAKPEVYENEFRLKTKSGNYRWIHSYARVVERNDRGEALRMIGNHVDITERKQAEDRLKASLTEKEILLRELYHRTKNTMQIICSMLMLQAARMPENDQVQQLVQDTERRIMSMALVHQLLYQAQDLSRLNLRDYLQELSCQIMQRDTLAAQRIALTLNIEPVAVLLDTALPCGLLLNELLSNALKHGFPAERTGTITITLFRNANDLLELHVADNGVGVPPGFDFRQQSSFGLQTVMTIAEYQLHGKITYDTQQGVRCRVEFPDTLYAPRV